LGQTPEGVSSVDLEAEAERMMFFLGDFFEWVETTPQLFDGIITDIPYRKSTATNCPVQGRLGGPQFSNDAFLHAAAQVTPKDAFLITFCNFLNAAELVNLASWDSFPWKFVTYQIWDKRPTRTWIAWSRPLRHVEFILYFVRGKFRFDFRTGVTKPPVKRSSFGGKLKASAKANSAKQSQEMFEEIVTWRSPRQKVHPTQKPVEASEMFATIVGKDKLVLDPFCGSGALLSAFPNSMGIDLKQWSADGNAD